MCFILVILKVSQLLKEDRIFKKKSVQPLCFL